MREATTRASCATGFARRGSNTPIGQWFGRQAPSSVMPMTKTSGDTQFSLTLRQRQVVELIALGCSNEEVGERLGISARTAKAHCDVLRQKLGVPRRRQIPAAFRTLTGEDPLACELAPAAAGVGG
jgi:DNA-binding CsgD family transcriptional regulator